MGNIFKRFSGNDEKSDVKEEEYESALAADEETTADEGNNSENWLENYDEGQLSIDVYQTVGAIVVKSTIAGVSSDDIDISINNDMLTIRGKREQKEKISEEDYLYRECYWGPFSRSIILPVEVEPEKIDAFLENGVLTVTLPKAKSSTHFSIKVKEK